MAKSRNKGKYNYTDGVTTKRFGEGDVIPEGWYRGSAKMSDERRKELADKRRKTYLEKYGVDNPAKLDKFKEKAKQTNLERYGVTCTVHNEEIQKKVRKTNLERYGSEVTFKSDIIKDKIKQTNLERYGAENPFASEEIKEKIKETHRQTLGVDYPMQSEEVREKSKQTSMELYGTEYPNQSVEVRKKILSSTLEHWGVEYPAQLEELREKMRQTTRERYGVDWYFLTPEARVSHSRDSKPNLNFAKKLDSLGIEYEREFHLSGYLYDFKVGNNLIEINPTATHNVLWNPFGDNVIGEDYHYKKSIEAEENGYRCIHIFDWDDIDKVVALLQKRERVYARDCEVREVYKDELDSYLSAYHLQGTCRGQDIRLGLYKDNILVSAMTFGKPRYNKNYEYELIRYASSYFVVGGAERLFSYFIKNYNPKSVISYCDKAKFRGDVYKTLGFTKSKFNSLSKHWYGYKENRHITDNLLRQNGYDRLFNETYGKGTSNEELMTKRGYLPVYDCGQDVWILKRG